MTEAERQIEELINSVVKDMAWTQSRTDRAEMLSRCGTTGACVALLCRYEQDGQAWYDGTFTDSNRGFIARIGPRIAQKLWSASDALIVTPG